MWPWVSAPVAAPYSTAPKSPTSRAVIGWISGSPNRQLYSSSHGAPAARFEIELEDHLTAADAGRTLRAATAWGRYAELFTYDDKMRMYSIMPDSRRHSA